MIVLIGDLHGDFKALPYLLERVPKDATLIQVGDFGIWPDEPYRQYREAWEFYWKQCEWEGKFYFIDGNHEFYPWLQYSEVTEIWPDLNYIPRGEVLEIDGLTIGFMGGAVSLDKMDRVEGVNWFPEEDITQTQFERLFLQDVKLDLLVTHSPPDSVLNAQFAPVNKEARGLPRNWVDISRLYVQRLYEKFECQLVCGHMHRPVFDGRCRILAINELYMVSV